MKGLSLKSVQGRLWAALTLLAIAVLSASAVTWFALQRVDARLQDLHQETLSQVAQALDLSKRSSDLATSAPYLLNQRSNSMIQQEGAKLDIVLDRVRQDWPQTRFGTDTDGAASVSVILDSMTQAITDLVDASSRLDRIQAAIRAQTARGRTSFTRFVHVWMPPLVQEISERFERVIGCGHVSGLSLRRLIQPRAGMAMREPKADQQIELIGSCTKTALSGPDLSDHFPLLFVDLLTRSCPEF